MTQEDKKLLLKDLSARFPYGVVLDVDTSDWKAPQGHIQVKIEGYGIISKDMSLIVNGCYYGDNYKPFLRSMSSMTEEEKREYKHLIAFSGNPIGSANLIDWLNKKMFAYRTIDGKDMFELGLALEAPEGMYK